MRTTEPRPDATLEHQQRREVHQSPHACTPWRHHRSFFVHGEVSSALHEETEFFHYSSWGKTWCTRLLQDQEHINVENMYKNSEVAVEPRLQIRTRLWRRTSFHREETPEHCAVATEKRFSASVISLSQSTSSTDTRGKKITQGIERTRRLHKRSWSSPSLSKSVLELDTAIPRKAFTMSFSGVSGLEHA